MPICTENGEKEEEHVNEEVNSQLHDSSNVSRVAEDEAGAAANFCAMVHATMYQLPNRVEAEKLRNKDADFEMDSIHQIEANNDDAIEELFKSDEFKAVLTGIVYPLGGELDWETREKIVAENRMIADNVADGRMTVGGYECVIKEIHAQGGIQLDKDISE